VSDSCDIPRPLIVSVDRPPPPELEPDALGVGLIGPPDSLYLVVHDELRDEEVDAIRAGDYGLAFKLLSAAGVAGLVWRIQAAGGDMIGYADYSLRRIRQRRCSWRRPAWPPLNAAAGPIRPGWLPARSRSHSVA
jgi:hypothetical protein